MQTVEGQIRAMKFAFVSRLRKPIEARTKVVINVDDRLYLVHRLEFGKDGTTAFQRVKEKTAQHRLQQTNRMSTFEILIFELLLNL